MLTTVNAKTLSIAVIKARMLGFTAGPLLAVKNSNSWTLTFRLGAQTL